MTRQPLVLNWCIQRLRWLDHTWIVYTMITSETKLWFDARGFVHTGYQQRNSPPRHNSMKKELVRHVPSGRAMGAITPPNSESSSNDF